MVESEEDKLDYVIKISYNNEAEHIYIPVLPESLEIKKKGKGQGYDIIGLGEINVIHSPELSEITFSSFFPETKAPYMSISSLLWKEPLEYIGKIIEWQASKHPCRLSIKAPNLTMSIPVSIEQFDYRERAGSGDIEYQLSLKEYRFYAPRRYKLETKADGTTVLKDKGTKRLDERVPPTSYALKAGDNLWKVAKLQLNDETRWREIQKLNNIKDADLKKLPIGLVLKLPVRA